MSQQSYNPSDYYNTKSNNDNKLTSPDINSSTKLNPTAPDSTQSSKKEFEVGAYNDIVSRAQKMSFDEFIADKNLAFSFYYLRPETKNLFSEEDIKSIASLNIYYATSTFNVFAGTCLATWGIDQYLRRKNLIYGLTYRTTVLRLLVKYFLIPKVAVGFAQSFYLFPKLDQKLKKIFSNYDFTQEVFRNTFKSIQKEPNIQIQ